MSAATPSLASGSTASHDYPAVDGARSSAPAVSAPAARVGTGHINEDAHAETRPFYVFGYGSLIYKPPPFGVLLRIPCYITSHLRRFWQLSEDHRGTPEAPGRVVTLLNRADYAAVLDSARKRGAVVEDVGRYGWPDLATSHASVDRHQSGDAEQEMRTYGVVYLIDPAHTDAVREYLGVREINGYSIETVSVTVLPLPEPAASATGGVRTGGSAGGSAAQPATLTCASQAAAPTRAPVPVPVPVPAPGSVLEAEVFIGTTSNPQFDADMDLCSVARHILKSIGPSGRNRDYLYSLHEALLELAELDDVLDDSLENGAEVDRPTDSRASGRKRHSDRYVEDLYRRVMELEQQEAVQPTKT